MRDDNYKYRTTILAAIVAILVLGCAASVAVIIIDRTASRDAALSVITAMIAPVIVSLLALLKTERTQQQTNGIQHRVTKLENGGAKSHTKPQEDAA